MTTWNTLKIKQLNGKEIDLVSCGDGFCADYTPAVSYRTESVLGNRSDYEDVTDTLRIVAGGSSELAAIRKLQSVVALITQAERWSEGENITPVVLVARESDDGDVLQSVIIGGEASQFADVSDEYSGTLDGLHKAEVVLSIRRRGVWTKQSSVGVVVTGGGQVSDIYTNATPIDMYDEVSQNAAMSLSLSPISGINFQNIPQKFYLITARSGKLVGQPLSTAFVSGTWATIPDASALSGSFYRTSSSGASLYYDVSAIGIARFVALFAYARRTGATGGSCVIRARSLENRFPDTDFVNVVPNVPSLIPLGTLEVVDNIQNVVIEARCFNGAQFDIERIVAVEVDNENTHIIEMINAYNPFATGTAAVAVDNSPTLLYPKISEVGSPYSFYGRGNLSLAFSVPFISVGIFGGDLSSWRACSGVQMTLLSFETKLLPD